MSSSERVFDLMEVEDGLCLSFPPEYRTDLLNLIKAKASRVKTTTDRKKASAEATRVRNAAKLLMRAIEGKTDIPDWSKALHVYCLRDWHPCEEANNIIGTEHRGKDWSNQVLRLLGRFVEAAEAVHARFDGAADERDEPHQSGPKPDDDEAMFARCLADHFVRAGGKLGNTGKPGFRPFLERVWELMPDDQKPKKSASFADDLARHVSSHEKACDEEVERVFGEEWVEDRKRHYDMLNARMRLLSLFQKPRSPSSITAPGSQELGEDPQCTIGDLVEIGHLVLASAPEALCALEVPVLKDALRSRGLKVSGRKAELAARLHDADPNGCRQLVEDRNVLVLTAAGREAVEQHEAVDDRGTKARADYSILMTKGYWGLPL